MKSIAVIQARMNSRRLKGKSLLRLGNENIIYYCYKAAFESKMFDNIIVATSKAKSDDSLVNYLKSKNIEYYRGSEQNVLSRYVEIYKKLKPENIARLTGDNPLIDPEVIRKVATFHLEKGSEYTSNIINRSWPRGNDVECINGIVLSQLLEQKLTKEDFEHVTLYIRKNLDSYNYFSVESEKKYEYKNIRLTVDYKKDYLLVKKLVDYFMIKNKKIDINEINKLYLSNPAFFEVNKLSNQTKIGGIEW